jgi:hypothetical protein
MFTRLVCHCVPVTSTQSRVGTCGKRSSASGWLVPAELAAFWEIVIVPNGNSGTAKVTGEVALLPSEMQRTINGLVQAGTAVQHSDMK